MSRITPLQQLIPQMQTENLNVSNNNVGNTEEEHVNNVEIQPQRHITNNSDKIENFNSSPVQTAAPTQQFKIPFMEDINKKMIKIGLILIIIIALTQNKGFQSALLNNLPRILKSTELLSNISVATISVLVTYLIYKFMD